MVYLSGCTFVFFQNEFLPYKEARSHREKKWRTVLPSHGSVGDAKNAGLRNRNQRRASATQKPTRYPGTSIRWPMLKLKTGTWCTSYLVLYVFNSLRSGLLTAGVAVRLQDLLSLRT